MHDDLYNTAKRLVTKLILRAKVAYFSTMIVQCSFSRQLFHVTNRPVDRKKPQVLPSCYPLVELPSALLTIFFWTKSEQHGLIGTVKHQSLTPLNQS